MTTDGRVSAAAVRVSAAPSTNLAGDRHVVVEPGEAWSVASGPTVRAGEGSDPRAPNRPGQAGEIGASVRVADPTGTTTQRVILGSDHQAAGRGVWLLELVVDGWRFDLTVESARRAALRERAAREAAVAHAGGTIQVRAIIPGRIVAVAVAMGDRVEAGAHLLVVEAMKMQNELRAPHAGTVERVAVTAGMTVERGDLLVVLGTGARASDPDPGNVSVGDPADESAGDLADTP
jgi:biotin carboxyl carrier protein